MDRQAARNEYEVGVVRWINENGPRAIDLDLDELDLNDPTALIKFCSKASVKLADLKSLGQKAIGEGVRHDCTEREIVLSSSRRCQALRTPHSTWQEIDGTVVRSDADDKARHKLGPVWDQNSCAVDCALMAGILLQAGRIQVDQIDLKSRHMLNRPAECLRSIVKAPWGVLSTEQRSQLRDQLRSSLNKFNPSQFPLGSYMGVITTLETVLDRLPQLSYTETKAYVCCDQIMKISAAQATTRRTGISMQLSHEDQSIEEALNASFEPRLSVRNDVGCCSMGENCTKHFRSVRLILDRLPPVLMLIWGQDNTFRGKSRSEREKTLQMFEDFSVRYYVPSGYRVIKYRPLGCVWSEGGHFKLRWARFKIRCAGRPTSRLGKASRQLILGYDGLEGEDLNEFAGWQSNLKNNARVEVMFYVMEEA